MPKYAKDIVKHFASICLLSVLLLAPATVLAATITESQSLNVTAKVYGPPPSTPAVITNPSDGLSVGVTPLVVSGTCGPGLQVKLFINNQLAGSTTCELDGTFRINITLSEGKNLLTVLNYDTLDQAGPSSLGITVTVTFPSAGNTTTKPTTPRKTSPTNPGGAQNITQPGSQQNPVAQLEKEFSAVESQVHPEWLLFCVYFILIIILLDTLYNRRRILKHLSRRTSKRS